MNFVHHCSSCERDQLIFPSMCTGATRGARGLAVAFTCWCGAAQTHEAAPAAAPRERHELAA